LIHSNEMMKVGALVVVGSAAAATEGLVASSAESTPALKDANLTLTGRCIESMTGSVGIWSKYGRAKVDKYYFSATTNDCTKRSGPCPGGDVHKVIDGYEHTDGTSDTVTVSALSKIATLAAASTHSSSSTFRSSTEEDVTTPKCTKGKCCWKESPNYHVEYYWGKKGECSGHVWFKDLSTLRPRVDTHCPKNGNRKSVSEAAAATEGLVASNIENTQALKDANLNLTGHCIKTMTEIGIGIWSKYGMAKVDKYYFSAVTNDCTMRSGPCPGGDLHKVIDGYEHTDGTSDTVSVSALSEIATLAAASTHSSSSTFRSSTEEDVKSPKCTKGKCCWKESPNWHVEYYWGKQRECSGHVWFKDLSILRPRTDTHCPKNGNRKSFSELVV